MLRRDFITTNCPASLAEIAAALACVQTATTGADVELATVTATLQEEWNYETNAYEEVEITCDDCDGTGRCMECNGTGTCPVCYGMGTY